MLYWCLKPMNGLTECVMYMSREDPDVYNNICNYTIT